MLGNSSYFQYLYSDNQYNPVILTRFNANNKLFKVFSDKLN